MLNYDEYRNLCCLINENPDIISVFDNMSMFSIDELSIDSHDIKNHLQIIEELYNENNTDELEENYIFAVVMKRSKGAFNQMFVKLELGRIIHES